MARRLRAMQAHPAFSKSCCIAAIVCCGARASAQTPATPPPATGSLSGVVRDVAGTPLADVSVTLLGESLATRTDTAGHFALDDVPVGSHTTLFRRIGYRSVEYRWLAEAKKGLQIAVAMTPVPRQLERVVVEAPGTSRRRGTSSIGGMVSDSAGHGVSGADVRLLGSGLSTMTDSSGGFEFQLLAAGSYIVRARRRGLVSGNYVMQIADDDSRGITIKLYGLPKKTGAGDTAVAAMAFRMLASTRSTGERARAAVTRCSALPICSARITRRSRSCSSSIVTMVRSVRRRTYRRSTT